MMRQGANSAVRFTTYTTLKQLVQGTARPGQTLPSAITFGIGGIAGLVTVYTTMPLEYVFLASSNTFDSLLFSSPLQCCENANAVFGSTSTVSKFLSLCIPYFYGGGYPEILDGNNAQACAISSESSGTANEIIWLTRAVFAL
jgi:hypothetical protein